MAVAVADGILGLEGIHTWNSGFVLNDLDTYPRAKCTRITGLHDLPEAEDNREPRNSQHGENIFPSYVRGKTVTYEGELRAATQQALAAYRQSMRAAFAERNVEGHMVSAPHATYGSVAWEYYARVLSCSIDDEIRTSVEEYHNGTRPVFVRNFALALRLADARYSLVDGAASSLGNAAGLETVNVVGDAPADPVFTLNVTAGQSPELYNHDYLTGTNPLGYIRMRIDPVPFTGALTVDFNARRLTLVSAGPVTTDLGYYFDHSYTDWWDEGRWGLLPGDNELEVKFVNTWDVAWTPRSW
jgi:hypothetical protein